jgi:hypothetical protein
MVRPRCPATSAPAFSSSELCALCVSAFSPLSSFFSGGSSDPCSSPLPDSLDASIPFRIKSFVHPLHLIPIESYSCKKQGRGWGIQRLHPTQTLPLFSTASKHPTHSNARIPNLFMPLLHDSLDTRVGGCHLALLCTLLHAAHQVCFTTPSFSSTSALFSKTVGCTPHSHSKLRISNLHSPLTPVTSHESPATASRTSTLPPRIYGIIPPHKGTIRNPICARGGFSD